MLKRTEGLAELDAGKETLAEFTQEWWQTYAATNLERATLQVYARLWNLHVEPRLGDRRLRDLTPRVIAQFRSDLESDGIGVEAIRKSMAMLQGILQRAVEWERLRSNPVRAVRKPPKRRQRAVVPFPPATIEQLRAALLRDGRLRDATLISVLGLRRTASAGGACSHMGTRPRADAAHRAGGRRWRAEGSEDGQATSHGHPARPSQAGPRRVAASAGPAADNGVRVPGFRRHAVARPRLAQLAPARRSQRLRVRAASSQAARTTCAIRSPRCSSMSAGCRSSRSRISSGTTRTSACRPTRTSWPSSTTTAARAPRSRSGPRERRYVAQMWPRRRGRSPGDRRNRRFPASPLSDSNR